MSPELDVIDRYCSSLTDQVAKCTTVCYFATKLVETKFISRDCQSHILDQQRSLSAQDRARELMDAVRCKVESEPAMFDALLSILKGQPVLESLATQMRQKYDQLRNALTTQQSSRSVLLKPCAHAQQESSTATCATFISPGKRFPILNPIVTGRNEGAATTHYPLEESCFDRYHSLMVPLPVKALYSAPLPTVSFKQEVDTLATEFSSLQIVVYEALKQKRVDASSVKLFINSSLSVSRKDNIPLFNERMQEMFRYSTLEEVFAFLSRHGIWCFLNFGILVKVTKQFADGVLGDKLREYEEKVQKFKSKTKLSDFLQVWSGLSSHETSEGIIPVIIKLHAAWGDLTLAKIAEQEGYLANEFELHRSIFRFANAKPGCVTIMWWVPSSVMRAVKNMIKERLPNLNKTNIEELIIGDLLFVRSDMTLEPRSYRHLYKYSTAHPEEFWAKRARKVLVWDKAFTKVMADDRMRWFIGGRLNLTWSVLDRHVLEHPDRHALIWESNEPGINLFVTYRELLEMTCRVANVLKSNGITKGDIVTIYMPAMPLTVACMLACARIGAIHSVVFAALKGSPLKSRIQRVSSKAVITATTAKLGSKELHLKSNIDKVLAGNNLNVQHVFVSSSPESQLRKLIAPCSSTSEEPFILPVKMHKRDINLMEEMAKAWAECEPVSLDSEDSLFLSFTSGSSAEPKIITHSQAGYVLYAAVTHQYTFDYQPGDVFACVADLGWVMAHTYVVYGPLCNGATSVLFGSTATYPNPGRYWDMVERLRINQLYVSTSAVKHLMKCDEKFVRQHDLSSLRTIGSGGEPLPREAWKWFHNTVGQMRCTLVDTWWQTETGGITIAPLPAHEMSPCKPGFTMKPFFGVEPVILNEKMEEVDCGEPGNLYLRAALPGMGRELNKNRKDFHDTYFSEGLYKTSDTAYYDSDGDYRIVGRASDTIRTQGVWLDVPEIECLMTWSHSKVNEVTLVGCGNVDSKEQKRVAFVELMKGVKKDERRGVVEEMKRSVERGAQKGHLAMPQEYMIVPTQPKTHSGKIVRYLLRQVADDVERDRSGQPFGGACIGDSVYDDQLDAEKYILRAQSSSEHIDVCC